MRKFCVAALCIALCVACVSRTASALTEFRKAFEDKYAKENENATDEFKMAVKKASCNVCHVKGKNKKERNAYGNALAELIEGSAKERMDAAKGAAKQAEKAKLLKELEAAFEQVEKAKVDPEAEDGTETFGERLHANKLPVELPAGDDTEEEEEEEAAG